MVTLAIVLMMINRGSGVVLPISTKYLLDDVIGKHRLHLLYPLVATVVTATVIQGITSFALTQTLSKSAERMIADLRLRVQRHVGRLSISYYDGNKTGALVARIMGDVEGARNLVDNGIIDFVGGLLSALFAFAVLIRVSPLMTGVTFAFLVLFSLGLRRALKIVRPGYRARAILTAQVTGRLAESLAGVRVVKGYHAEAREHEVFRSGVERLLQNAFRTLTSISLINLFSSSLMGVIGTAIMLIGTRQMLAGKLSQGDFIMYIVFLGYLGALLFQVVRVGTQLTEAVVAWSGRASF